MNDAQLAQQQPTSLPSAVDGQGTSDGAKATATVDDRSQSFRPVTGGGQMQSGEKLLVEAYAAIWIVLFLFIAFSWRKLRRVDGRLAQLEEAVNAEIARAEGAAPSPGSR